MRLFNGVKRVFQSFSRPFISRLLALSNVKVVKEKKMNRKDARLC